MKYNVKLNGKIYEVEVEKALPLFLKNMTPYRLPLPLCRLRLSPQPPRLRTPLPLR